MPLWNKVLRAAAAGGASISESSYTGSFTGQELSFGAFSESVAIGTADADRTVVFSIGVGGETADLGDPSGWGITIGGVSATVHVSHNIEVGGEYYSACICSADVPTGTTATVAGNNSSTGTALAIGAVRIVTEGTLSVTTSGYSSSPSLSHTAGTVSVASGQSSSASTNITWNNATEHFEHDAAPGTILSFGSRLHDASGDVTISRGAGFYCAVANFEAT